MKLRKLFIYLTIPFLLNSCDDSLNIDPKQSEDATSTLSTEEGITNILVGSYALAANGNSYGGRLQIYADLLGNTAQNDRDEISWDGSYREFREIFNKRMLSSNYLIEGSYARLYEIINATNTVIENIDKVKDEDKQITMIGEANFLRSLAYFDLVRLFAKPYVKGQINSQLGVVIREKAIYDFNTDLSKERSTVEEVYKVIIDGLKTAYESLPEDNDFYADKYAAQALLARVYLQQGNYVAARDAANDVIENSGHTLATTYAGAFNRDTNSNEDIFSIQITKQTGTNDLITFYAADFNGGRGGDILVNDLFYDKFDAADVRKSFNYKLDEDDEYGLTSKYTNQFGNISIIRLAEMYLIRAEANLVEGTTVGNAPIADINIIRERAQAPALTTITLSDIYFERELELAFEGFLIHDIKRTKRSIDMSDDGDASDVILFDADRLVFPIPLSETDTNKKITQNPGYIN